MDAQTNNFHDTPRKACRRGQRTAGDCLDDPFEAARGVRLGDRMIVAISISAAMIYPFRLCRTAHFGAAAAFFHAWSSRLQRAVQACRSARPLRLPLRCFVVLVTSPRAAKGRQPQRMKS